MTDEAAQRFAETMRATWSNGPTTRIWRDYALHSQLQLDFALAAYRRLQVERVTITVAVFHDAYREQLHRHPQQLEPASSCDVCDSTGFVPGPDIVHDEGTDYERRASTMTACRCPLGRLRVPLLERIVDSNRAHVAA